MRLYAPLMDVSLFAVILVAAIMPAVARQGLGHLLRDRLVRNNEAMVVRLGERDFEGAAFAETSDWLVLYCPMDGQQSCKDLAAQFLELRTKWTSMSHLSPINMHFGEVDCRKNVQLCQGHGFEEGPGTRPIAVVHYSEGHRRATWELGKENAGATSHKLKEWVNFQFGCTRSILEDGVGWKLEEIQAFMQLLMAPVLDDFQSTLAGLFMVLIQLGAVVYVVIIGFELQSPETSTRTPAVRPSGSITTEGRANSDSELFRANSDSELFITTNSKVIEATSRDDHQSASDSSTRAS